MTSAGGLELSEQHDPSGIVLRGRTVQTYIAVEGPIGVGKTTLARRIAGTFDHDLLLEEAEMNPFLERFYQNRQQTALATQLFFLFKFLKFLRKFYEKIRFRSSFGRRGTSEKSRATRCQNFSLLRQLANPKRRKNDLEKL